MRKRIIQKSTLLLSAAAIILQLSCFDLWGLDPQKKIHQYLSDQWEIADGVPSNTILCMTQTPDGYLWLGTSRGLVRFDGRRFSPEHFSEKEEIYSLEISTLWADKDGILRIGSPRGLTSYRYCAGESKTFSESDGITIDGIRHIKGDMSGNLWISFTASYINRLSGGRFTAFGKSHGLTSKKINSVIEDSKGNLLFGSREDGGGIFIFKEGKFSGYPVGNIDNAQVITMFEDGEGELWIGTNKGLFRVTGKGTRDYTAANGLSGDYITSVIEDSDRNIWVRTSKGLSRVKKKPDDALEFENLSNSFPVNCLFEDKEKSIWIGTDTSGIKRLKNGKFMSYSAFESQTGETPLSLFEDRNGNRWIGTACGKLFCRSGDTIVESQTPPNISGIGIAAIAEDKQGTLWIGTTGKGVFQNKNRTFTSFTEREGLADNTVTSILCDSRGNVWFCSFDGVSLLLPGRKFLESMKAPDGLCGKVAHNV